MNFFRMNNPQLKIFVCFKQCLLLLMTISVGASHVLPPMKSYTVRTVSTTSSTVRTVPTTSSTVRTVSTNYEKLQKCPSGLDLYSPHNLKPSAIKLIVTGLNTWPSKGLLIISSITYMYAKKWHLIVINLRLLYIPSAIHYKLRLIYFLPNFSLSFIIKSG